MREITQPLWVSMFWQGPGEGWHRHWTSQEARQEGKIKILKMKQEGAPPPVGLLMQSAVKLCRVRSQEPAPEVMYASCPPWTPGLEAQSLDSRVPNLDLPLGSFLPSVPQPSQL